MVYRMPLQQSFPWRYVVTWDKQEHVFNTFFTARNFLVTEIWWLAEDSGDDEAFKAWEVVRKWEPPTERQSWMKMKYEIRVGKPAATYRIVPEFQ